MKWKCAKCGFETFKDPGMAIRKLTVLNVKINMRGFKCFDCVNVIKWFSLKVMRQMLCSWECRSAEMRGDHQVKKVNTIHGYNALVLVIVYLVEKVSGSN